mmetsp:Transcript_13148/g.34757  ORF Transcript_13148/g.34757 Transcript_13148/m.34757 type:complete len:117 (+) Transcript_13148:257-607(+)
MTSELIHRPPRLASLALRLPKPVLDVAGLGVFDVAALDILELTRLDFGESTSSRASQTFTDHSGPIVPETPLSLRSGMEGHLKPDMLETPLCSDFLLTIVAISLESFGSMGALRDE